MPRETQRRKTRREQVSLRADNAPQLQPSRRPLGAIPNSSDKNVRAARALERAFNIGTEFAGDVIARRAEKFSLAGQRAAAEGREPTPEELKQDAFMRGYNAITTDRELVELEGQAVELYSTLDVRNLTSEQVASKLDELFQSQYEGVDTDDELDRDKLERVLPRWNATVEKVLQQHQQDNAAAVEQDVQSSVAIAIEHEVRTTGTIDLETRNRQFFQIYGPQNSNDELVATVTAYAIDAGKPELIEELQGKKTWASNAPAPGGITEYNTVLQNAKAQAEAQKRYNDSRADKEAQLAQAQFEDDADQSLLLQILDGNAASIPGSLSTLIREKDYDAGKARQWINFANSYQRADVGSAQPDWNEVADLELRILQGDATLDDITASVGSFGSGKELADITVRFARNLRAAQSAIRNDPKFTSRFGELQAIYSANADLERELPQIQQRRAEAARRWSDLIFDDGIDPDVALKQVQNELPPKDAAYWNDVAANAFTVSPTSAVRRWNSGTGNAAGVLRAKPEDAPVGEYLLDLLEAGSITNDQYQQLKDEAGL